MEKKTCIMKLTEILYLIQELKKEGYIILCSTITNSPCFIAMIINSIF